jgi:tetratricopeptide (TPR) repeat protein
MSSNFMPDLVIFSPHVNAIAGFLLSFLFLGVTLSRYTFGPQRWLWVSVTGLLLYGLFISGSRGAWLGLVTASVMGLILQLPATKTRRLAAAGLGSIILVGYVLLQVAPLRLPVSIMATIESRLQLYQNVWHLLPDYVVTGIGPGQTFAMVYSRYQLLIEVPFLTYAHNMLLAVGLAYGILGIVALIWLLINFCRYVVLTEQKRPASPIFRAAWLSVTAIFVHGLVDASQFSGARWTLPPLFALLGLTVLVGNTYYERPPRWKGWARYGIAVGLAGALIAVWLFANTLLATWYANWGAIYQTKADLSPYLTTDEQFLMQLRAVHYFETAQQLAPNQPTANRRLGMIALENRQFDVAVTRLQIAAVQEPHNQATLKALGLAYLWTGQLDQAEEQLRQLDSQYEIVEELGNWQNWWLRQGFENLSDYAVVMGSRLGEQ